LAKAGVHFGNYFNYFARPQVALQLSGEPNRSVVSRPAIKNYFPSDGPTIHRAGPYTARAVSRIRSRSGEP